MTGKNDISFRDSVNQMFSQAVKLMDLPSGLEEKIIQLLKDLALQKKESKKFLAL